MKHDYKKKSDIPPEVVEDLKEMGDWGKPLEEILDILNEHVRYLDELDAAHEEQQKMVGRYQEDITPELMDKHNLELYQTEKEEEADGFKYCRH
jgi:predicted transcriptional regulator